MQPTHKRDDNWSRLLLQVGKKRDSRAFEALFNHFAPLIKGFCLNRSNNSPSAEAVDEFVQEVMVAVWNKAPFFEGHKASASTWIFTILRNCRIEAAQRDAHAEDIRITVNDVWDDVTEKQPFIFLHSSRNEGNLAQGLQRLPVEQFHVMKKLYTEGKSHSGISEEMGLPAGAVQSRVQLALKKLQLNVDHPRNAIR